MKIFTSSKTKRVYNIHAYVFGHENLSSLQTINHGSDLVSHNITLKSVNATLDEDGHGEFLPILGPMVLSSLLNVLYFEKKTFMIQLWFLYIDNIHILGYAKGRLSKVESSMLNIK